MGKVQSDKIEKVKSFSCGGVKSLSVGDSVKNYESHFKELNMEKFGEFMFGIRFAFEFFGYKAIPDERGKDSDVFKRAIYNLAMENEPSVFLTAVAMSIFGFSIMAKLVIFYELSKFIYVIY